MSLETPNVHPAGALMQGLLPSRRDPDLANRAGLSEQALQAASEIFDARFYLMTYPDVVAAGVDPFEHYLLAGRFEKRKPCVVFDPADYAQTNPEVTSAGFEPFLHYALIGKAAGAPLSKAETIPPRPRLTRAITSGTKRLIIFLSPGFETLTGGVLSIAAIWHESERLADLHRANVALCALPGDDPLFLKYGWFKNNNYLLHLNAVLRSCSGLDYLQLHIPEYAVDKVVVWLHAASSSLLRDVSEIHLNVLIQNIDLAEERRADIEALKQFGQVTATTGHEAYTNAAIRKRFGIPLHRLGVCVQPELYERSFYPDKKPIMVVSHDKHPLKEQVLQRIAQTHPNLQIRVIKKMSYENYRALAAQAKWSLTFGEGLDGYFAEPIFHGGNSFAVFNDRFFTPAFAKLRTVYPSWEILLERMPLDLELLDEPVRYSECWREAYDLLTELYRTDRFRENLRAFYRGEYTFP
jgi:hypothetical protein